MSAVTRQRVSSLDLVAPVLAGKITAIARLMSRVESGGEEVTGALEEIYRHAGKAHIVGITGVPGSGKSTLLAKLAMRLRAAGRRVGIIAVDPTSPFSGGAVLGDRVRMQTHTGDVGVFVRSMATRGELGGLARATSDAVVVLDAAGFDLIVIETVGVGQAEVEISRTADMTAVVTMPGAGDGVQALKAGVMEIADLFVVNKADHAGADRAVAEIQTMLGLHTYQPEEWRPPVLQTRATDGTGVPEVIRMIDAYCVRGDTEVGRRRRARFEARVRHLVSARLLRHVEQQALEAGVFARILDQVVATEVDPYTAAEEIVRQAVNTTSAS